MLRRNTILRIGVWVMLMLLVMHSTARTYTNDIALASFRRTGGWHFLDRMVFGKGTATAKLTAHFISRDIKDNHDFTLEVAFVDDYLWAS